MYTKAILPALAAISVSLASAQDICSESTVTINSAADATQLASCDKIEGSVVISSDASGDISIDGPDSIEGDLTITDNGAITSFSSSSITSIGGAFTMKNVTVMTTLTLNKLTEVKSLDWQSLNQLETVTLGSSGLSSAESVRISDTFLSSLDAISVSSVATMEIDNNHRLTSWTSGLESLTTELVITANGFGLEIAFPKLVWAVEMTINNVSSISIPVLETVNKSMRFDSNFFESFDAPNMTSTDSGDISFTDNGSLTNITFPALTSVGGGFTIANNTKLEKIDGFENLKTIGGAVLLRGNFSSVELPALNDVKGAFDIASTTDISSSCGTFDKLSSKGGNGKIQGTYSCVSNNENANDASNTDSGSSSGNGTDSAAPPMTLSMPLLGLAAIGGIAQALM